MGNIKYCRACFVTDVRMYDMDIPPIKTAYIQLLHLSDFDSHEKYICFQCSRLLFKYEEFRSKCSKVHDVLVKIERNNTEVTPITVQHINELSLKESLFESNLVQTPVLTINTDQTSNSTECTENEERMYCYYNIKQEIFGMNEITEANECTSNDEYTSLDDISSDEIDFVLQNKRKLSFEKDTRSNKRKAEVKKDIKLEQDPGYLFDDEDDEPLVVVVCPENAPIDTVLGESMEHLVLQVENLNKGNDPKKTSKVQAGVTTRARNKQISLREVATIEKHDVGLNKNKEFFQDTFNEDMFNEDTFNEDTEVCDENKPIEPESLLAYFEDYATVEILTPEDAKKEVLLRKETRNYKFCPYKCELCYRGYEGKITYENHMKKHSPEYGEHICDFCYLRFSTPRSLWNHTYSTHQRKFSCKICPYVCYCTYQAKRHTKLHKGKKYPCKDCGKSFSVANSLYMHRRYKHLTECVCDLCGGTFATERGLRSHKMKLHRDEQENKEKQGPKCDECNIQFATEVAWKRHMILSSKHKIRNGCEICGETFQDEIARKRHKAETQHGRSTKHLKEFRPGPCSLCNVWLSNRVEYVSHKRSEHPQSEAAKKIDPKSLKKESVCDKCGHMFTNAAFLRYHVQSKHTNERPFKCKECDKAYSSPSALYTHRRSHEARQSVDCAQCDKCFMSRSALLKHIKTAHLGLRPHKCPICDKAFRNLCDVKLHTRHVHYKEPWPQRFRGDRGKGKGGNNDLV